MRRICVFCGSSSGARPAYAEAARRFGASLAARGLGLVYGGGGIGLMGVLADAVLEAGGEAIGVIPAMLQEKELGHARLTRLHVTSSMHGRKALMADLADAFVALPGGFGTLEELAEVLTWAQLGLHSKPVALLDAQGYWRPLVEFFDHAVNERFARPEHRAMIVVDEDGGRLLDSLANRTPPPVDKWLDPKKWDRDAR